jgi:hypothetical protein
VSKDPYFYLTRDDLLELLRTHDDQMITHILDMSCKLHIKEDIGYKLISIKGAQVDKNQHTAVALLDFLSVMIENKREDKTRLDSKIMFSHNYVLQFLEMHS